MDLVFYSTLVKWALPSYYTKTNGIGSVLAIERWPQSLFKGSSQLQKYSPKIRSFNTLNKINPSVPAAPKWRISAFEKIFCETERS